MVLPIFRKTAQTRDTMYLLWQMAKDSYIFSTAMVFLSWKLPGSSMHTTVSQTAASQISLYTWSQCTQRTFWYCMTALAILHNVNFFANTIYVGLQVFMGATTHENWISWNFSPRNNLFLPQTFPHLRYILIAYTITYIWHTQDQYTLWQSLCSTVYRLKLYA